MQLVLREPHELGRRLIRVALYYVHVRFSLRSGQVLR